MMLWTYPQINEAPHLGFHRRAINCWKLKLVIVTTYGYFIISSSTPTRNMFFSSSTAKENIKTRHRHSNTVTKIDYQKHIYTFTNTFSFSQQVYITKMYLQMSVNLIRLYMQTCDNRITTGRGLQRVTVPITAVISVAVTIDFYWWCTPHTFIIQLHKHMLVITGRPGSYSLTQMRWWWLCTDAVIQARDWNCYYR